MEPVNNPVPFSGWEPGKGGCGERQHGCLCVGSGEGLIGCLAAAWLYPLATVSMLDQGDVWVWSCWILPAEEEVCVCKFGSKTKYAGEYKSPDFKMDKPQLVFKLVVYGLTHDPAIKSITSPPKSLNCRQALWIHLWTIQPHDWLQVPGFCCRKMINQSAQCSVWLVHRPTV
jgi:hypothetical protein